MLVKIFDVSTTAPETLLNLACVDTWLAQRLRNTDTNGFWQILCDIYSSQETYYATVRKKQQLEKEMQKAHELMPNVSQPAREILRLAGKVASYVVTIVTIYLGDCWFIVVASVFTPTCYPGSSCGTTLLCQLLASRRHLIMM